jgi:hypothetical protein
MLSYAGIGAAGRSREDGMAKRKGVGAGGSVAPAGKKGVAVPAETEDLMVTTFRITRSQWDALRREAMQRALGSEKGDRRPDASRLVREALGEWLAKLGR